MKTILSTVIFIMALLWVSELTVTLKPFSISLPGWYKAAGILLFSLAVLVFTAGERARDYKRGFDDGVKKCIEILENKSHE